jgi:hypothetical protein
MVLSAISLAISAGFWLFVWIISMDRAIDFGGLAQGLLIGAAAINAVAVASVGMALALIGILCEAVIQRHFSVRLGVFLILNALAGPIWLLHG